MRIDSAYATVIAGTMSIRGGTTQSSDRAGFFSVDRAGMVYAGASAAEGQPLIQLDADAFHTFSFVLTFSETPSYDAYVDGVLLATDLPLVMPAANVTGTNQEWFQETVFFNMSSTTNEAGDSSILMDNIKVQGGDTMSGTAQTDGRLLVLYAGGGEIADLPSVYTPGMPLPVPKIEGADFLGWYTAPDFSGEPVAEVPADATGVQCFYAKWDRALTATFIHGEETVDTVGFKSSTGSFVIEAEVEGCAWLDTTTRKVYAKGATVSAFDNVILEAIPVYGPFENGSTVYVDNDYSGGSVTDSDRSAASMSVGSSRAYTVVTDGDNRFMQVQSLTSGTFYYDLRNVTGSRFTTQISLRAVEGTPLPNGYIGYKQAGTTGPQLLSFSPDGTLRFLGTWVGTLTADEWLDVVITIDGEALTASLYINGLTYVVDAPSFDKTGIERPIYFFLSKSDTVGSIQLDNLKIYDGDAYLTEVKGDALVLDLDGGTVEGELPTTYDPEKPLTLPELTKEGAVFRGWYDNPEFAGEPVTQTPVGASGALFYYAKWGYTVSFDGVEQEMTGTITLPETAGDVSVGWWKTQTAEGWTFYNPNDTYRLNAEIAFVSVSEEVKANTEGVIAVAGEIPLDIPYFALVYALAAADDYEGKETEADYPGLAEAAAHIAAARAKLQQIIDNQKAFLTLVDQVNAAADLKEKAAYAVDARALQAVLDITYPEVPEANLALTEVLADAAVAELMRAADAYLAAVATLTPGANYQTVKAAVAAAAEPGTILADLFANSEVLSGAKATLDSMNAAADALAEMAEDFIAGVTALDLNADYATFVAAMEALEGTVVTDVTVPGVAEVIEKYETAQARLDALKGAQAAFFNSIAQLETTLDYATIAAIVETAEKLKPFIDPTAEGLADAEEALVAAREQMLAIEEAAKKYMESVKALGTHTDYADRRAALAVATVMAVGVDDSYPGVQQAKQTMIAERVSLDANDAFASAFSASVQKFITALRLQDQYRAYAEAYALSRDERLDLTNPAARTVYDAFETAVAAYERTIASANSAMADAMGATAGAAIASQEQKPASVVSSLAQVAAGE